MAKNHLEDMVVLYAEDDDGIRAQVAHFLSHRCARLILAETGHAALDLFHSQRPDIIVSDILMPEMDGLELATAIKSGNSTVPIILTTAFNDAEYLLRAIEIGIDEYVLKPISLEKLLAALIKQSDVLYTTRTFTVGKAQLEASHHAAQEKRNLVADLMQRMMRPE